jgi:hypothetical protein
LPYLASFPGGVSPQFRLRVPSERFHFRRSASVRNTGGCDGESMPPNPAPRPAAPPREVIAERGVVAAASWIARRRGVWFETELPSAASFNIGRPPSFSDPRTRFTGQAASSGSILSV